LTDGDRLQAPSPTLLYRFVASVSWPFVRFLFRTHWEGVEGLPEGGFVLAANHASNFDAWPIGIGVRSRFMRFMTKAELFRPPLGSICRALGGFPIHRGEPDRTALATAVSLCEEGNVVVMFPEGTRRSKGLLKRRVPEPHTGAARIALRAGVPLVPVGLSGTDRLSRFGPIRVRYGRPIEVGDLAELGRKQAAQMATERLMQEIEKLRTAP
jgi:1-acyl-sn-glycerol-3-phosphate acyltransferase